MQDQLLRVADRCDGVRCDMAMLLEPEVIARTWGDRARPADGSPPVDAPFWPEAIARVRRQHPGFLFLAEVYWGLDWRLQQQGFDFTYDKTLYDRLRAGAADPVRAHLRAEPAFADHCARFLENHDEPRAAAAFPPDQHRAAAALTYLVPGLRFFHEGQLEGRRARAVIQLTRRARRTTRPGAARDVRRAAGAAGPPGAARRRLAAVRLPPRRRGRRRLAKRDRVHLGAGQATD